jgi:hypothetical protein
MTIVVSLVTLLFGLALLYFGTRGLIEGAAAKHWAKVQGKVSEVVISTRTQRGAHDRYCARLHYKYVFNGVVRRGYRVLTLSKTSLADVERQSQGYSAGQAIEVLVNPRRPHKSRLEAGFSHDDVGCVIWGVALLGLSLWVAFQ